MKNTLVLIPTYNEAENVEKLYLKIKELPTPLDILFIDDNSPDGTANIIQRISNRDKSVKLIKRAKKKGIGSAHLTGIKWAYNKKYKTLITMDSDLTHKPSDIVQFLKQGQNADIVIGSRYIRRDSLAEWNLLRKFLTISAHILTKRLLSMPYDATGAFRLYNLDKISKEIFNLVESRGYSFFFESLFILFLNGSKIREVAISLPARTYGMSKMRLKDAINSLVFLFKTSYFSKIYKNSYMYAPRIFRGKKLNVPQEDEWDAYWKGGRKNRKILYDSIAAFYRKYIIKKNLNRYIKTYFPRGAKMLHAGSGGGQVDEDIVKFVNITALDISSEALNRYKSSYKDSCLIIHGSIFNIPVKTQVFDGVYNLGVMEHFTQKDIKKILDEFYRVLKPNGKILLFWPPFFGLSVLFLNVTHFVLNTVLKKKIRLHPHEITKVKSKKQIQTLLEKSGFKLQGFYFGPSDLFTYVVVLGQKIKI